MLPGDLALVMLGDVMLGRIVDESLALPGQQQAVWGDFLPLLQGGAAGPGEACLVTGNLECAVTQAEEKEPKEFNFKLHPAHAGTLTSARFGFVSLANNHSLDYQGGLQETLEVLGLLGIAHAGAGLAAEAEQPAVVSCNGLTLAFFSYADHPEQWAATPQRPGINYIDPEDFDAGRLRAQLAVARDRGASLTVVFIHWGPNWRWLPSKPIQQLGHAFIDCGADIVFGHSSHHIQGIEVYKERPIVYGAGGWIDDYRLHEDFRNDLGFLYCCHIKGGQPHHLELIPSKITHEWQEAGERPPYVSAVGIARGEDATWLERTLQRLCGNFVTQVERSERGLLIPLCNSGRSMQPD